MQIITNILVSTIKVIFRPYFLSISRPHQDDPADPGSENILCQKAKFIIVTQGAPQEHDACPPGPLANDYLRVKSFQRLHSSQEKLNEADQCPHLPGEAGWGGEVSHPFSLGWRQNSISHSHFTETPESSPHLNKKTARSRCSSQLSRHGIHQSCFWNTRRL